MTDADTAEDRNRIADAIVHVTKAISEESQLAKPGDYVPGDPGYDGMHALLELLQITRLLSLKRLPPMPVEIAELVSVVARMGDAVARTDDDLEQRRQERKRRAEEIEKLHTALSEADEFTVRITRADGAVVNVGPYPFLHTAANARDYFDSPAISSPGAKGATYEILPYDEKTPHRAGDIPAGTEALVVLLATGDEKPGDFPDLFDRLAARHTEATARDAWGKATNAFDAARFPAAV
jgi:hypothetical protein